MIWLLYDLAISLFIRVDYVCFKVLMILTPYETIRNSMHSFKILWVVIYDIVVVSFSYYAQKNAKEVEEELQVNVTLIYCNYAFIKPAVL